MSLDNRAAPNDGAGGARPQRRGTKVLPSRGRKLGLLVPGSLILAGLLLFPPSATEAAAQQGTISGEVVERGTLRALRAAQVMVPDLGLGALTGANGQYSIENVPAGTHEVRVQALGFETMTQEVTVAAGQVATLDFQLGTRAVALDELVVTGVGVVQERRQLGQTIASIGSADIEEAVSTNLMELLQGRVSGMTATPMGEVGQSAPIVLRGIVSLSQRNSPVIYIDGIRMDNTHLAAANLNRSPLNDLNMSDIERVEVIKGAAAATLYGTEASAGVIQITTRRGTVGAPTYSFEINQQFSHLPSDRIVGNYIYDSGTGGIVSNHPASDFLKIGHRQDYNLSVRGGGQGVQYFASGRWADERGVLPVNAQDNAALRTNLSFQHTENLESEVALGLVRNTNVIPQPAWGLVGEFVLANPLDIGEFRPYGELFNTIGGAMAYRHTLTADHATISGQVRYRWAPNLRSEVRVGYNRLNTDRVDHVPPGVAIRTMDGLRLIGEDIRTAVTLDASTAWDHDITPSVRSSLVVGGQSFWEEARGYHTGVRGFPSPGLGTLRGGASVYTVDESMSEVINAGFFVQEQIAFQNRLFLTAGLRMDGNSAFGEDFGLQAYPKFGTSWVVSDHDFWNLDQSGWNHLRLRAAYGTSGLQPGAFDAQRTWQPVARLNNEPAVYPLNLGNPDLKPERSVELEFGVEMEFLDGRLGADAVYWRQETQDALLQVPYPPSQGFLAHQLTNIGAMESSGVELGLQWAVVRRPDFSWTLRPQVATLNQEVTDMGTVAPFRVAAGRRWNMVMEGFSPGAKIAPVADPAQPYTLSVPIEEFTSLSQLSPNFLQNAAGGDSLVFIGDSRPTLSGSLQTSFEFPRRNLSVRALLAGASGFVMSNESELIRDAVGITERQARFQQVLADPNATPEQRQQVADEFGNKHPTVISAWMEDADYLRFQELMVTYRVSDDLARRVGMSNLQVSLGARNIALWTRYSGMNDPSSGTPPDPGGVANPLVPNVDYYGQPYPRRFVFQLRGGW
jgi:TonB-dependent starch-binding outer membrane protein SusC